MIDTYSDDKPAFEEPLHKHYFKMRDFGGLLSITPFTNAEKFKIDIGQLDGNDKLVQATEAYVEFVSLAAFLRAVVNNTVEHVFLEPKTRNAGTLVQYGGGSKDGQVISRILKIAPDLGVDKDGKATKPYGPGSGFVWKCGHFAATKGANGAIVPDMSKPIQQNFIKTSRQVISEIAVKVDLFMTAYAVGKTRND